MLWPHLPQQEGSGSATRSDPFPLCLRYEEEVSLRATAENEFVALKKVRTLGQGAVWMEQNQE